MNTQENYVSGHRSLECGRPNVKTCCLLKNSKELREAQNVVSPSVVFYYQCIFMWQSSSVSLLHVAIKVYLVWVVHAGQSLFSYNWRG